MNKVSLYTIGKKLQDGNLYILSVYDVEPSGVIIHAYDQVASKEYHLPISEYEMVRGGFCRNPEQLERLVSTIDIVPHGDKDKVLQSNSDHVSNIKRRLLNKELEDSMVAQDMGGKSLNELIVSGLVELCKNKPVGLDAVKWLGEWLLANNPAKPNVTDDDD